MKFALACAAVLLITLVARASTLAVSVATPSPEAHDPSPALCGDPRNLVPLLRAWSSGARDHFYTTNAVEMDYAVAHYGYTAEGTTGYVFSDPQPGTVPFYRLWNGNDAWDHFYTTCAAERDNAINRLGYMYEGIVGYVCLNGVCGGVPLYRSYNGAVTDHFYTMSAAERDNAVKVGWTYEGIAAFLF